MNSTGTFQEFCNYIQNFFAEDLCVATSENVYGEIFLVEKRNPTNNHSEQHPLRNGSER